jgi:CheY-like chemotaxis protein
MSGGESPAAAARKVRILIVDDNSDAAHSLARLLSLLGKEVRVCLDGSAALAELAQSQPDVVLMDLGMHGMDGFETAKRIRDKPEWNSIPLVALTGWGQEQDKQRTSAAGFMAHLVKPVNIEQIEAAISQATKHA